MSPKSRREYFDHVYHRYIKSSWCQKRGLLSELCHTLGYNRKYAIRKISQYKPLSQRVKKHGKHEKRGRRSFYSHPKIKKPLVEIWMTANMPCSKRLKIILPLWLSSYEKTFGALEPWVKRALYTVSPATMDRVMYHTRIKHRGKGRCTTKPGLLLKKHIPIKVNQWDEKKPGFLESDLVAHCGQTVAGVYANTLNTMDIATGWSEQRALFGKGHRDILEQLIDVEKCLPFDILGFDCDNGTEFMNKTVLEHFLDRKRAVQFTRSRAYRKNDNAHVEGKNWTHVRQWLGYGRFENPKIAELLNDLYRYEWRLFHNFFLPSVKLIEKRRVGSRIIKIHDSARTPYQRIMMSRYVSKSVKDQLTRQMKSLNPFILRRIINEKVRKIHQLH